jgi:hypothetical protein
MNKLPKITMPGSEYANGVINLCSPTLVQHKRDGDIATAFFGLVEVLFFRPDGNISFGTRECFKLNYTILRQYLPGELLTITA